jgi:hypothetical protein
MIIHAALLILLTAASAQNATTAPSTSAAAGSVTTIAAASGSTAAPDANTTADTGYGTIFYSDGEQYTLNPAEVLTPTNIQISDSSTLFITNNSVTINGYCADCTNSTIALYGESVLVVKGEVVSIYGSNQTKVGGSAIQLNGVGSKALMDGSILVRGGDCGDGVGGVAIEVFNTSLVDIDGDVIIQGGNGVEKGKSLVVGTGSSAEIKSGWFIGIVQVESTGEIEVSGGTFLDPVTVMGDGASATFNGCFLVSEQDSGDVNIVELSGNFAGDSEMKTINVTLFDGATLNTNGNTSSCASNTVTTSNSANASGVDDEYSYRGNSSDMPTGMPTFFEEESASSATKAASKLFLVMCFVIGQYMFL